MSVDRIKERFIAHQVLSGFGRPAMLEEDSPLRSSPSLDDMDEPSSFTNAKVAELLGDFLLEGSTETNESNTSIFSSLEELIEDLEENKDLTRSAIGLSGLLIPLKEPFKLSQWEMGHTEQFSIPCLGADLTEISDTVVDSYVTSNIITETYGDKEEDVEHTWCENLSSMFGIPMDCDLPEALGPSFQSQSSELPRYEAPPLYSQDFPNGMEPSAQGKCVAKVKNEDLLEAVIANVCDGINGSSPNSSEILPSSESLIVQCDPIPSSKSLNKTVEIPIEGGDNSVLGSNIKAAFATGNGNSFSMYSNLPPSNSTVSYLTDKKQPRDGQKRQLSGNKRKCRSGDSQRSRPRDRQLIQDRVKELRELVPDGSKVGLPCLL